MSRSPHTPSSPRGRRRQRRDLDSNLEQNTILNTPLHRRSSSTLRANRLRRRRRSQDLHSPSSNNTSPHTRAHVPSQLQTNHSNPPDGTITHPKPKETRRSSQPPNPNPNPNPKQQRRRLSHAAQQQQRQDAKLKRGERVLSKACYDCGIVAMVGLALVAVGTAADWVVHVRKGL